MIIKAKAILLGGLLGTISSLLHAGLMNDVPYAMRDLHTALSPFKDYKKLASHEFKKGRTDEYYSPSSIREHQDYRGNWEEFTRYSVVLKTVSKNGYALERVWLECDNNEMIISSRLYYGHNHQVLPQAQQKIIAGSSPRFKFSPNSSSAKLQNIICKK